MKRALTVRNIIDKKYDTIPFTGDFLDAFGTPESTGVWFIWGNSGNGKTRFVMQLCRELCKTRQVLFIPLEEGSGMTFRDAVLGTGIADCGRRFLVRDMVPFAPDALIEELKERVSKQRSADVYVIDSFQYTGLNFRQYVQLKDVLRNKLLIFTSQADGKQPVGRSAKSVMFDAMLKVWVEGHQAFSKGRFIGPNGGTYTIWTEGAERYWPL